MDLYEIRGGRLDVISEEAEHQLSRDSTTMEHSDVVPDRGARATREVSTFQRFSVDTNESLRFEPCEDSSPSPTGAEDGLDDVFKEGKTEVGCIWFKSHFQESLVKIAAEIQSRLRKKCEEKQPNSSHRYTLKHSQSFIHFPQKCRWHPTSGAWTDIYNFKDLCSIFPGDGAVHMRDFLPRAGEKQVDATVLVWVTERISGNVTRLSIVFSLKSTQWEISCKGRSLRWRASQVIWRRSFSLWR